jgi:toxin ParE1/3/4
MAKAAERWRVEIAHAADADIREIDRWTERQFGAVQAEAYAAAIANAIAALIAGPQIRGARPRTDMRRGFYTLHLSRFQRHARHFVVFRVSDPERRVIDVLRVLHDAMDLVRHLPGEASDEEDKR